MSLKKHSSREETTFRNISLVVMCIIAVTCILPFVLMFSASITGEKELIKEGYKFWPSTISLDTYKYLWAKRETIGRAYGLSIFVTLAGTLTNLVITSLFAYPLYRKDFKPRNAFAFLVFFTMLFSGGMTASYIMWTEVFKIKNTIWALIIPGHLMGAMNVLLVRNYYSTSIPESIVEAARIDGASEFKIYTRIMVPLSKPVLITIALFSGIGYWNDWTNGMYYITNPRLYTITVYLNNVMNNINLLSQRSSMTEGMSIADLSLPTVGVRMAIAFTAIIPIIIVFPLIQSKLIEGVVVGGVKG